MPALLEKWLKVFSLLLLLLLAQDRFRRLPPVRGGVRVGDADVDDRVRPRLPKAADENIAALADSNDVAYPPQLLGSSVNRDEVVGIL